MATKTRTSLFCITSLLRMNPEGGLGWKEFDMFRPPNLLYETMVNGKILHFDLAYAFDSASPGHDLG